MNPSQPQNPTSPQNPSPSAGATYPPNPAYQTPAITPAFTPNPNPAQTPVITPNPNPAPIATNPAFNPNLTPAPAPAPSPNSNSNPNPATKKSSKLKLILALTVIIILTSFGVGIYILTRPNYLKISNDFMRKLFTAPIVDSKGKITLNFHKNQTTASYPVRTISIEHQTLLQKLPIKSNIKLNVNLTDNTNYTLNLELIALNDQEFYFKFNNLNTFLLLYTKIQSNFLPKFNLIDIKSFTDLASKHQDTWWKISLEELRSRQEFQTYSCLLDNFHDPSSQLKKAHNAYSKHSYFSIEKITSNKQKQDQITAYKLSRNPESTSNFIAELQKLPVFTKFNDCANLAPKEQQKALNLLRPQHLNYFLDSKSETTIGIKNSSGELVNYLSTYETPLGHITQTHDLNYPEVEQTITQPLGAKDLSELVRDLDIAIKIYQKFNTKIPEKPAEVEIKESDKNCSYFQGSDPTDRCYRAGCGSSADIQKNPQCLPKR